MKIQKSDPEVGAGKAKTLRNMFDIFEEQQELTKEKVSQARNVGEEAIKVGRDQHSLPGGGDGAFCLFCFVCLQCWGLNTGPGSC